MASARTLTSITLAIVAFTGVSCGSGVELVATDDSLTTETVVEDAVPEPEDDATTSTTAALTTAGVDDTTEVDDPADEATSDPTLSEWGIGFCAATAGTGDENRDREQPTLTDSDHPGEQFAEAARLQAEALDAYGQALTDLGTPPTSELEYAVAAMVNAIEHDVPVMEGLADAYYAVSPDTPGGAEDAIQELDNELYLQTESAFEALLGSEDLGLGGVIIREVDPTATTTPDDRERELIAESDECQQLMMGFMGGP